MKNRDVLYMASLSLGFLIFLIVSGIWAESSNNLNMRLQKESIKIDSEKSIEMKKTNEKIKELKLKKLDSLKDEEEEILNNEIKEPEIKHSNLRKHFKLVKLKAIKKFKDARNAWKADPYISKKEKKLLISQLSKVLFENPKDIPKETEEDINKQKELNLAIKNLETDFKKLESNLALSEGQKKQKVMELLNNFLN